MIIGLASPRIASSLDDALRTVERLTADAAARSAEIVCFPEAYLPGLRVLDFEVPPFSAAQQEEALAEVGRMARTHRIAVILGMERTTAAGARIVAAVIGADGRVQGFQTKNQLDPAEAPVYVPGDTRRMFEVNGVPFGITICHEGFRYPETVRWAAVRGARIVFHQHHTGSDRAGVRLTEWGAPASPYYEKAMMCRALENTVWFASVGCATRYQESATSLIDPSGACVAHLPYGREGVLVHEIDPDAATGLLAGRYAPERYAEAAADAG
ncbi:carbon-nitrogen hydrolase family protein [Longimicrobium sp.]|uniref:carbon-nitrogen hydrolase family protein n=1 Tax=Longimicrobium sp. TaxID=2029185 RepID=UPI002E30D6EB|nr:carbon-nitrogen hydrolase family protein [Longimicrobium sp.]HEX6037825.1 carbon-nitrogen hydrolase family protein [Longimicrobium sp.]